MGKKIRNSRKRQSHKIDEIRESLNEKQKLFAELYISDKDCFGNATKAYRTAYNLTPSQFNAAGVSAHHLLRNPKIKAYINELLDAQFKDDAVDREAAKIVKQDKDLVSKGMMIKEYNKIKNRVIEKSEVTHKFPKPILHHVRSDDSNKKDSILAKAS